MNSATVADLRNHFRRVSAWLENGESVEIFKRGKLYARLSPIGPEAVSKVKRVDFRSQCEKIWKGRTFTSAEVEEMRESERGEA